MSLEQSLASRRIARLIRDGFGREYCISATARFLVSQGFGAEHSRRVASEAFELVAP